MSKHYSPNGFRPEVARRALARESKYHSRKAIDGEKYSLKHPVPAYLKGVNWGNAGKGAAIGMAAALLIAGLSGFGLDDGNAAAEHDAYDPCGGQPAYFGDGEWNVTYKEGEKHRWFLQGVFGYSRDDDSIKLKTANPCTDNNPVSPIVYFKYRFSKDEVPELEKLDKQFGCYSEYVEKRRSCDVGIDHAIDFGGIVNKIEKWEENIGENMYLDAINVSIEAEGPVNGIKISDGKPENNLLLPLTAAGIAAGLGISGLVYKQRKKRQNAGEVIGRTKTGEPVYGK